MKYLDRFLLAGIITIGILLRIPSLSPDFWNVDEAVTAAVANTILEGGVPYLDAADHKPPVTYYIYAIIFKLFGANNMIAARLVLMGMLVINTLIIHRLGQLIIGRRGALFAALLFSLLASLSYGWHNVYAFHMEWPLIFFTSLGTYLLMRGLVRSQHPILMFGSGAAFSLAALTKQPAVFDLLFMTCPLLYFAFLAKGKNELGNARRLIQLCVPFFSGFIVIGLLCVVFFFITGAWEDFVFYIYTYNSEYYVPAIPWSKKLSGFIWGFSVAGFPFGLGVLTLSGVAVAFLRPFVPETQPEESRPRQLQVLLALWALGAYFGASLSGRGFGHYFIQILPPWCLLSGLGVHYFAQIVHAETVRLEKRKAMRLKAIGVIVLICLMGVPTLDLIKKHAQPFFSVNRLHSQATYSVADYIKQKSNKEDPIFVWGFHPQLYALADRSSASRYIYCNFLTGLIPWENSHPNIDTSDTIIPGTWEVLLGELQRNRPVFIVDTSPGNYLRYGKYPIDKFEALKQIVSVHYVLDREFRDQNGKLKMKLYALKE